jgi:glutathione S-transferase
MPTSAPDTIQDRWVATTRWLIAPSVPAGHRGVGTLITFPLSHFCEKARWALDDAGLGYRELGYAPGVHKHAVRRHGSRTVPLLVGEQTLRESTDILSFADRARSRGRALHPADGDARREIERVVERLDLTLGPDVRLWFYAWALADPRRLYEWGSCGLCPRQRLLLRVLSARIAILIAHSQKLTERSAEEARERIDEELAGVSAMLADGRRYLGGDSFGAADLSFAALAGIAVCAPGYGGTRLRLPPMPDELAPQIHAWRATPAGQLALRLYREHRLQPCEAPAATRSGGCSGAAGRFGDRRVRSRRRVPR